jgi:hypothetical protein
MWYIAKQRIDATNLCRPPHCRSVQHALIKGRTKQRDYSRDKVTYTSERVSASLVMPSIHPAAQSHFQRPSRRGTLWLCAVCAHNPYTGEFSCKAKVSNNATKTTHDSNRMWKLSQKATLWAAHKAGGSTSLGVLITQIDAPSVAPFSRKMSRSLISFAESFRHN